MENQNGGTKIMNPFDTNTHINIQFKMLDIGRMT